MPTIIESIELDFCTISLRSDGIIEQRFAREDPYEITEEVMQEFIDVIKSLYNGVFYQSLVFMDQLRQKLEQLAYKREIPTP